jgi:hypothetical protein
VTDKRIPRLEIPNDVAADAAVPEDLDSDVYGPYAVPEPARRRSAGLVYLGAALLVAVGIAVGLPGGMGVAAAGLGALAAYHAITAWHLAVREDRALETANRATEFPVGHASAAMSFEGWRARPVWNVLVFSADDPPTKRGLVRVDALSGEVVETYTEAIVERADD